MNKIHSDTIKCICCNTKENVEKIDFEDIYTYYACIDCFNGLRFFLWSHENYLTMMLLATIINTYKNTGKLPEDTILNAYSLMDIYKLYSQYQARSLQLVKDFLFMHHKENAKSR